MISDSTEYTASDFLPVPLTLGPTRWGISCSLSVCKIDIAYVIKKVLKSKVFLGCKNFIASSEETGTINRMDGVEEKLQKF